MLWKQKRKRMCRARLHRPQDKQLKAKNERKEVLNTHLQIQGEYTRNSLRSNTSSIQTWTYLHESFLNKLIAPNFYKKINLALEGTQVI